MEQFTEVLGVANEFLYSKFLIILLIIVGLYFTIRTGFVQIRLFPESLRVVREKSDEEGSLSSFQALMIATASRVGTGNIAGVSTAIVMGGPGALLWMWIMAVIGGASAFIESTLAQVYKEKDGKIFKGGPAYYIQRALGARWLGIIFSILLILTFAFGFNGLQSYNISSAFEYYVPNFSQSNVPMVIGIILAVGAAVLFFGGTQKIGRVSSVLVPIMAVLYIIIGLIIFFANISYLPHAMKEVVAAAFDWESIFGGFAGSCVVLGIKRGLFSNEAGMGSAPNAAAAANVSHPAKQGLVQVLSVFIDTLLLCSTTAFIVLLTDQYTVGGELNGIPLVQQSVASVFGTAGIHFVTVAICLFAFTSLIGNYFYAEANIKFISENKGFMLIFRILAILMIFVGAQNDLETAWGLADVIMGCMATVNIIAIMLLGGIALKVLKDYQEQKAQGLDPVFKAEKIGIHNTDLWK
ncbi:alanine:cation symporter family protein [Anaerovorax odorimutans]|uniref:Alanine:cation symporter family protein n=1 Tax=Anaerovorax odorimutans TaxID=109327 RepID=A0ABT1RNC7_9FIRM|nr:alanine/glycine:cation symporter family protein [Anaerovorax odorimutans]MCQ4636693.1 alanine:cation symporter family protein [Anaerovorax odorimutans]